MPSPTHLYTISQPTHHLFQHLPETIRPVTPLSQAHPWQKNSAQYDAYLNTISIYIRLLERFYKAFFSKSPKTALQAMVVAGDLPVRGSPVEKEVKIR